MKVVFIEPGGGVRQQVGDVGVIIRNLGANAYQVKFNYNSWYVMEEQMRPHFDVTETLKSLKRCLKSEI